MAKVFFRDEEHPWIKDIKFNDLKASDLLSILAQKLRHRVRSRAVLFDLDSTLFNLGLRHRQIFGDFLRTQNPVPLHWHRVYSELGLHNHEYIFERTFLRIFKSWNAELAEEWTHKLMEKFRPFWEKRFFSNWPLFYDQPYAGAPQFVHEVLKMDFEIVYLTGRDRPGGQGGTMASLKHWNFPWNMHTHLFMKPAKIIPDLEFKAQVSDVLRSRFDMAMSLDNEPENCVMFADKFPQSDIVFFHSIMSPRMPMKNYHDVLGERAAHRLKDFTLEV